jgi:hypothetical protein
MFLTVSDEEKSFESIVPRCMTQLGKCFHPSLVFTRMTNTFSAPLWGSVTTFTTLHILRNPIR